MAARWRLIAVSLLLAACGGDSTGPEPVASVSVQSPSQSIDEGATLQLTASVRNASGNLLSDRAVSWSSSSEAVARVSSTGLVTAVAPGQVTITAASGGQQGQITITVVSTAAARVTGVSPAVLQAGQTATLQGENFDPSPQGNIVRLGGAIASVISATTTSLQITVPDACLPGGAIDITVEVGGRVGPATSHPLSAPQPASLAVGEQAILRHPADLCFRLGASTDNQSYLVGVQSTSQSVSSLTRVFLRGIPATAAAHQPPASSLLDVFASSRIGGFGLPVIETDPVARRWRTHRRAERGFRHLERRFVDPRRMSIPARNEIRALNGAAAARADVAVGDTLDLRVPDRTSDNFCELFVPVRAVARAVGQRGVWLDDIENPQGFTTTHYEELSQEFDDKIYATNVDYFGEPTDVDGNGRILILTTQAINRHNAEKPDEAVLGFVTAADLVPRADGCVFSNEAEIYYGVAPDPQGALGWKPGDEPYTVAAARADATLLIAHEFTHIIQLGRRLADPNATTFQTVWELEGQATLAEEVVGHAFTGRSPRQDYGRAVALNWDDNPTDWYFSGFVGLAYFYGFESREDRVPGAPQMCSWLDDENNGPCSGSAHLVYGVPWSLLRWISDHYGPSRPGGEQALHRALVDNGTLEGYANLVAVTQTPIGDLLAQWAAMLYVDNRISAPTNPRLTMLSWNLLDIFEEGLVETARLRPPSLAFTSFSTDTSVRAGSTAYYVVEGANRPAMGIRAAAENGDRLPPQMQMWVVRLR